MVSVSTRRSRRKRKTQNAATTNEAETQIDWSKIGPDVLEYIQKKFLPFADILRCRSVCSSWRSITKTHISSSLQSLHSPSSPPLIIWKEIDGISYLYLPNKVNWSFIDVLKIDGSSNLYLPNKKSEQLISEMGSCVGGSSSNGGYFLFLDREDEKNLYLFHPRLFSGCAIRLPPIRVPNPKKDNPHAIEKAVLWADPSSSSYGIVAIHRGYKGLLFAKCGATRFTELVSRDDKKRKKPWFVDVICVKNRIYGITYLDLSGHYFKAWDCSSPIGISGEEEDVPRMVLDFKPEFSSSRRSALLWCNLYLVESQGDILLVAIDRPYSSSVDAKGGLTEYNKFSPMCQVYKMDFEEKKWVQMNSLGDRVLIITNYQSMSLSSHELPQYQRNSIYYWHYVITPVFQPCLGIFNMEDGSIKLIEAKKC